MSFSTFQKVRAVLPHEAARTAYQILRPRQFAHYESLHQRRLAVSADLSFRPLHHSRSIFIHVPKVAGTSVGVSLYGRRTGAHMSLIDYRTAFPKAQFAAAFKFTFVRNPWDRLASAYFYLRGEGRNAFDRMQAERSVLNHESFEEFVLEFLTPQTANALVHFREQHLFLRLPGRGVGVDFIGRFETLEADFDYVAKRLGKSATLSHENPTQGHTTGSDYRALYTPAMIDQVAKIYARDIKTFGYSFD